MHVDVRNLGYQVGKHALLSGISLSIESGKKIGLLGPNGSGKTTLLKLIAGLIQPSQGQIAFNTTPSVDIKRKEMAQIIGLMAQHSLAECPLLVKDIVLLGQLFGRDHKLFKQVVSSTQIDTLLEQTFYQLSGGEQQRVMLAQLLYQNPNILLLDEPANHLDMHHIWQLMSQVSDCCKTVITSFHCFNSAAQFCDELVLLKNGNIHTHGNVEQVLTPKNLHAVFGIETEIVTKKNGRIAVLVNGISSRST